MKLIRIQYWCVGLIALACLAARPARAQFNYTLNNGAITITGYTGAGGDVVIPDNIDSCPVTIIDDDAFCWCSSLTSVTIPTSVTRIGLEVFDGCSSLTNITVNSGNPNYTSAGGVLFSKDMTTLIQFPGGVSGGYAIPNTVTCIGDEAFSDCSDLTSVTQPNCVTNIGFGAFRECYGLTNLSLSESITRIGEGAFNQCANLATVTLPQGITLIEDLTFYMCSGLTGLTLPNGVTNIDNEAFCGCVSLTNITVNSDNPHYTNAGGVLFNKNMTSLILYPGGCSGSYTIPNSVTHIANWAFSYSGLTRVTIPSSVTCIGDGVFADCAVTSVTIPNSITNIGDWAFSDCSGLTSAPIPNSVTHIGDWAFSDCSGLTSVPLPNSITSLGFSVFYECYYLTNMTIPHNVTNIGGYAFARCLNLHQVFFQGNAPSVDGGNGSADSTVFEVESGTVYYLPGTTGWGSTFGGWPTAQWYQPQPQILGSGYGLGGQNDCFQFTIVWATNAAVVVEASTNLLNWEPVVTNTLSRGTNLFSDATGTNYPRRFYRVRSN